jgi:biotin/methionine sulfoxide reductase
MTKSAPRSGRFRTSTHWGAYDVLVTDGRITGVEPFGDDPDPSSIGQSLVDGIDHPSRIARPAIRKGWLENGPGPAMGARGAESFVEVSWEEAWSLAGREIHRIRETYGNDAIYAGSYGWASAGRFHHAQSQLRRFLNLAGGFSSSVQAYSYAAAEVIVPRILGTSFVHLRDVATAWPVLAANTELIVSFGGVPMKNAQVNSGGIGRHVAREWLETCRHRGVEFVNIGPVRGDVDESLDAEWLALRPNTDTALMLGLAHTLLTEGLHDEDFLGRYCVGFDRFSTYLRGDVDGQPKDAAWAAEICGLRADAIVSLARRMAEHHTLITLSWSIQRGDHGEQPYWMGTVLAAMLGQIGTPGGGIGFGYAAIGGTGNPIRPHPSPAMSLGENKIDRYIPVARVSDMLLSPGAQFDFDGRVLTYPDIHLVYWAGGNPFHHHQDLNRLVGAWQRPDTVIVNEPWWNANARHADIVFPVATTLERNDIGRAINDDWLFPMQKALDPIGEAKPDFEIFAGLARELGFEANFTENRSEAEWLEVLYDTARKTAAAEHIELPEFPDFWAGDGERLALDDDDRVLFADFRDDPDRFPLGTPSGRIEIFSETIDSFGYEDCPGHPVWLEPVEWLGSETPEYPLHLISNQPATRLHSQLDNGANSQNGKVAGREPVVLHPRDAAERNIVAGDVVRVFNGRGQCLAGAALSDTVMRGVVVLATGAWYDPESPGGLDRHGNPNVLTIDKGTSKLAQAPSSHTTLVDVEKVRGTVGDVGVFEPPIIESR